MRLTLIHPPLDDPTQPYHSLAYLAGQLEHNGFKDFALRDINIEFVNYCLEESQVNVFKEEIQNRVCALSSKPKLGFIEQDEYYSLWRAPKLDPTDMKRAVDGLRTREIFLDLPAYLKNAAEVEPVNGSESSSCWIISRNHCVRLGKGVYKVIQMSSQQA